MTYHWLRDIYTGNQQYHNQQIRKQQLDLTVDKNMILCRIFILLQHITQTQHAAHYEHSDLPFDKILPARLVRSLTIHLKLMIRIWCYIYG